MLINGVYNYVEGEYLRDTKGALILENEKKQRLPGAIDRYLLKESNQDFLFQQLDPSKYNHSQTLHNTSRMISIFKTKYLSN